MSWWPLRLMTAVVAIPAGTVQLQAPGFPAQTFSVFCVSAFVPAAYSSAVNATLRRLDRLDALTPVEVARRLRHLPGLVFFDSAGNAPATRFAVSDGGER